MTQHHDAVGILTWQTLFFLSGSESWGSHTFFSWAWAFFPFPLSISSDSLDGGDRVCVYVLFECSVAPEFCTRLGTSHPSSQQLDVIEHFSTKSSQGEHTHTHTFKLSLVMLSLLPTFPLTSNQISWESPFSKHQYGLSHPGLPPIFPMCFEHMPDTEKKPFSSLMDSHISLLILHPRECNVAVQSGLFAD